MKNFSEFKKIYCMIILIKKIFMFFFKNSLFYYLFAWTWIMWLLLTLIAKLIITLALDFLACHIFCFNVVKAIRESTYFDIFIHSCIFPANFLFVLLQVKISKKLLIPSERYDTIAILFHTFLKNWWRVLLQIENYVFVPTFFAEIMLTW